MKHTYPAAGVILYISKFCFVIPSFDAKAGRIYSKKQKIVLAQAEYYNRLDAKNSMLWIARIKNPKNMARM